MQDCSPPAGLGSQQADCACSGGPCALAAHEPEEAVEVMGGGGGGCTAPRDIVAEELRALMWAPRGALAAEGTSSSRRWLTRASSVSSVSHL